MHRKSPEETGKYPELFIVKKSISRFARDQQCEKINFTVNTLFLNDFNAGKNAGFKKNIPFKNQEDLQLYMNTVLDKFVL